LPCVQEALRRLLAECAHVDVRRAALAAAAPQHPAAYDSSFLLPFAAMVGCTQGTDCLEAFSFIDSGCCCFAQQPE
jgi:hypothetical protein